MNIGLIGLGAMGGAYAKHLLTNNFNCYGIDLDKKNISRFLNLGGSEITYPNLFNKVDVVLLSLPSLEAYKNVLENLKKLGLIKKSTKKVKVFGEGKLLSKPTDENIKTSKGVTFG